MCLAPRYISGPTAAPRSDWRNTASFPDTPCASSAGESARSAMATSSATRLPATAVLSVAGVARFVERTAELHDLVRTLRVDGVEEAFRRVDHRLGDREPFRAVRGAAIRKDEPPRLRKRGGIIAHGFPFLVGARNFHLL